MAIPIFLGFKAYGILCASFTESPIVMVWHTPPGAKRSQPVIDRIIREDGRNLHGATFSFEKSTVSGIAVREKPRDTDIPRDLRTIHLSNPHLIRNANFKFRELSVLGETRVAALHGAGVSIELISNSNVNAFYGYQPGTVISGTLIYSAQRKMFFIRSKSGETSPWISPFHMASITVTRLDPVQFFNQLTGVPVSIPGSDGSYVFGWVKETNSEYGYVKVLMAGKKADTHVRFSNINFDGIILDFANSTYWQQYVFYPHLRLEIKYHPPKDIPATELKVMDSYDQVEILAHFARKFVDRSQPDLSKRATEAIVRLVDKYKETHYPQGDRVLKRDLVDHYLNPPRRYYGDTRTPFADKYMTRHEYIQKIDEALAALDSKLSSHSVIPQFIDYVSAKFYKRDSFFF